MVKTKEDAGMKQLLAALSRGTNIASILIAVATFGIFAWLFGTETNQWWQVSLSVVVGLLSGVIIGKSTEYYTSQTYKPTQKVSESAQTGPATVIISGMGLGMLSTAIPVVTVGVAIVLSYLCANGFAIEMTGENLFFRYSDHCGHAGYDADPEPRDDAGGSCDHSAFHHRFGKARQGDAQALYCPPALAWRDERHR